MKYDTITGCDNVIYKGIKYTSSQNVWDTIKSYQGCDSIYKLTYINISNKVPYAFICNSTRDNLSVVNLLKNITDTVITVGRYPKDACVSPDGSKVYTAN